MTYKSTVCVYVSIDSSYINHSNESTHPPGDLRVVVELRGRTGDPGPAGNGKVYPGNKLNVHVHIYIYR